MGFFQNVANAATNLVEQVSDAVSDVYQSATNTAQSAAQGDLVIAGFDVSGKVRDWAKKVFPILGDGANSLLEIVKDFPGFINNHIMTPVTDFLGDHIFDPVKRTVIEPISDVSNRLKGVWDGAVNWVQSSKQKVQQFFDQISNLNPFEAGYNLFKKALGGAWNVSKQVGGYITQATKQVIETEIRKNPKGAWVLDNAVYFIPAGALIAGTAAAAYTTPMMNVAKLTAKTTKKIFNIKPNRPMLSGGN